MTRRAFLAAAALAASGGAGLLYRAATDDEFDPGLEETRDAARLFGDLGPARRVGRAYLDAHPDEEDEAALVRLLERRPGWRSAWNDPAALAGIARRAVRDEYAKDMTVSVDGWLLSRSEARLCALVALG